MTHEWVYRTPGLLGTADEDAGPFSEPEMLELAGDGSLALNTPVSSPTRTQGNWYLLSQIPGLAKACQDGECRRREQEEAAKKQREYETRLAREATERERQFEQMVRSVPPPPPPPTLTVPSSKMDVQCPACSRVVEAILEDAPRVIQCPICRKPFLLPGIEASPFAQQLTIDPPVSTQGAGSRVSILDGQIQVQCQSLREAKLAIKELRLLKKTLSLQKRQLMEQMRVIRAQYTAAVRERGSKFRHGGWVGAIVRDMQTYSRDAARADLANQLDPYERERQWIEYMGHQADSIILQVQMRFGI